MLFVFYCQVLFSVLIWSMIIGRVCAPILCESKFAKQAVHSSDNDGTISPELRAESTRYELMLLPTNDFIFIYFIRDILSDCYVIRWCSWFSYLQLKTPRMIDLNISERSS